MTALAARTYAADALHPASRGAIGDQWNHRVRNVMVVAEISAALVLLLATILLVQNLLRLQDLDPGFNPDGVFQARVSIPPASRSPEDSSARGRSGCGGVGRRHDAPVPRRVARAAAILGLFGAFALTAVLLAVSGLYGLVAYAVGQRTPEIGLRMAMGATERDVRRMILRQAAGTRRDRNGGGPVSGWRRPASPLGNGPGRPAQPAVVTATAALLIAVVLMAAWLPARRAARIEPTVALKGQ